MSTTPVVDDDYTPQRSTASDVNVSIAGTLFATQVNLVSIKESGDDDTKFPYACPGDHGGAVARMSQRFTCPDGHLFEQKDLHRARESADGTLVLATKDEIATLKTGGMDKAQIELHVHPRAEVDAVTRPDGLAHRLRPGKKAPRKAYAMLKAIAADPDTVAVGWLRLKDARRLFRLELWNDQLVLQALIDIRVMRGVDKIALPELADDEVARVVKAIKDGTEPFDPAEYTFDVATEIANFVEERAKDPDAIPAPIASVPAAADDDLLAMLEASVAETKPKKAPAKKAAAKRTTKAA